MTIISTLEEKLKVVEAIQKFSCANHVQHMSQLMLANETGIKVTKIRIVLTELVNDGLINRFRLCDSKIRQVERYYYTFTNSDYKATLAILKGKSSEEDNGQAVQ